MNDSPMGVADSYACPATANGSEPRLTPKRSTAVKGTPARRPPRKPAQRNSGARAKRRPTSAPSDL